MLMKVLSISIMISFIEIKEEKLNEYTDGLVKELSRTSLIMEFAKRLRTYMPKYNELKHFNAHNIVIAFLNEMNVSTSQS